MDLDKFDALLRNSPTVKLLRSRHAALIITFFHQQFKERNEIAVPNSLLVQRLADYLDQLDYNDEDENSDLAFWSLDYQEKAKRYIERWTEENYLRNYMDDMTKEVVNILTKHTEKVFQVLELLKEREFVGTESKFRDIFLKLRELIDNTTDDPQRKIEELENRKREIEDEIRAIKRDGFVKSFENYQIKSRFEDINRLTNELIGDFREVEDNFKDITRGIYEKQTNKLLTKGTILRYTFDALDELKESDQGKSFYAFWSFLINDASQEELRALVVELYNILEDRGIEYNNKFLRKIKTLLHMAGRKVLDSNDLLADKLSRVIAEKDLLERRKARETIHGIRFLALQLVGREPVDKHYCVVDGEPEIAMPMERKLGEEPVELDFSRRPENTDDTLDIADLAKLFNPHAIDKQELLRNVHDTLRQRPQVTLAEVINEHPVKKGLGELIGYVSLLNTSEKYVVNDAESEFLLFDAVEGKYLKVPQIIFTR